MQKTLRIAIAQINCIVGDLAGNCQKITEYVERAKTQGADIVVFPELALTGYPPEDLLLKPQFIRDNLEKIRALAKNIKDIACILGFVDRAGKHIYNSAALIYAGKIKGKYYKTLLPNYGVFDEQRYFTAGREIPVFQFGEFLLGVNICEDIWHIPGPVEKQVRAGAKLIININASPYHAGKIREREAIICRQAKKNRITVVYANLVGGQDELVFDGQSMVVDARGKIIARAKALEEDLLLVDLRLPVARIKSQKGIVKISAKISSPQRPKITPAKILALTPVAEIYQVLLLGLRDYVRKNNFKKVVIGLSGGIDSALVAALATDALGKENIIGAFMPSPFSSAESEEDAHQLAENLGIKFINIPITEIYQIYLETLQPLFSGLAQDISEENLQARIRGNILMALSNKFKWLVLATGNKSEMSTGYATLYGDMAGGFAVIKDVPKILVYKLSRYRNRINPVIPERVLTKEPTAELRHNQKDSDTLPVYETLDPILKAYIEDNQELARIVSGGFNRQTVEKVLEMVDKSEYKRRQSPPGIKITHKAFGKDRRMPITNRYRG